MKVDSLWYEVMASKGTAATVTLRRCPNCGKVKVLSNPCGFDHLAALMEFGEAARRTGVLDRDDRERAERAEARIEAVRALAQGWHDEAWNAKGKCPDDCGMCTLGNVGQTLLFALDDNMDRPERISRDLATDDDWIDWTDEEQA